MMDFYDLLGVKENDSKQKIKIAYGKMIKKYHYDIKEEENTNQVIKSLKEAKETLLDDEKREKYNLILEEIKHSKQFSVDEEETYSFKLEDYYEIYPDITKRQILFNYLKNGVDKWLLKILRLIVVILNFLLFIIIKGVTYGVVFLIYLISGFIDKVVGLIMLIGILSLFLLAKEKSPNVIPLIPANIESFCFCSIIAFIK